MELIVDTIAGGGSTDNGRLTISLSGVRTATDTFGTVVINLPLEALATLKGIVEEAIQQPQFNEYKQALLAKIKRMHAESNDEFVLISEDGEMSLAFLRRAMKELHEEGHFRNYETSISPNQWSVKPR